mgnify:CR=1 FL=1
MSSSCLTCASTSGASPGSPNDLGYLSLAWWKSLSAVTTGMAVDMPSLARGRSTSLVLAHPARTKTATNDASSTIFILQYLAVGAPQCWLRKRPFGLLKAKSPHS